MLEVFPTSRAVRSFYDAFIDSNTLLPKAITIAELEQKAILVPHHALIDEDMRVLLMQEASHFTRFELLHIEREFFTFLKNSSYLFRFFEELSHEKVSIASLQGVDTYEQYAEHLEVLHTLLKHYKALLSKHALYDRITLVDLYEINEGYIGSLGEIRIHLEGFLSRFELEMLFKIAALTPLHVTLTLNTYNQKMATRFEEYGVRLTAPATYEINLSTRTILHVKPHETKQQSIQTYGFSSRFAQLSFVQNAIAQFVKDGMEPCDIVVVLPDEAFAEPLRVFDQWHNLNFAMGITLKQTVFYQSLHALERVLRHDEIEDHLRLKRLKIDEALLHTCKERWHQKVTPSIAISFLEDLLSYDEKSSKKAVIQEALFAFKHFLHHAPSLRFEQMVKLFLNRLSDLSEDDIRGGKVTVLGLLETRGVAYKGVIVVDVNDEFVPKRSQKDLFLSSSVRSHAGLPTKKDRENLQRYYYHRLFSHADNIAIAYVKNELSMPSRFLDELGLDVKTMADEKELSQLLFKHEPQKPAYARAFIDAPYDMKQYPLSATKLKTLLTCKRQFYFRYIAKLKEAKMPSNTIDEQQIGLCLHAVLEEVMCDEVLRDEKKLLVALEAALKAKNHHEVWEYFVDVWLRKLNPFMEREKARYEEGYRIVKKEVSLTMRYEGFVLEGQIDRIDEKEGKLFVIDYKSGKVPLTTQRSLESTVDFQLLFYALLAGTLGFVEGVFYYDLKEGLLVEEVFLEEKKSRLDEILKELSAPINGYELCEETKHCRLCPYVVLCQREGI